MLSISICLVCFFDYGDLDLKIVMVRPNTFRKRTKSPSFNAALTVVTWT
jgi:hypothetical protein